MTRLRRLVFACALLVLPAAALNSEAQACSGIRSTGNSATATEKPNRLNVSIVVKNTSEQPCRVFANQDTTAVDNAGHNWLAHPATYSISGVYVCERGTLCNTEFKDVTEEAATIIEPQQEMVITLSFSAAESTTRFGDLVTVGFVLMGQSCKEEPGVSGPTLNCSRWRSLSVGAANMVLKTH